jgi:hypothetical protein
MPNSKQPAATRLDQRAPVAYFARRIFIFDSYFGRLWFQNVVDDAYDVVQVEFGQP